MASRSTSSSAAAAPSTGTPPPRTPAARQSRPSSAAPRSSPGPSRPASAARLSVKAASVSERLSKPHARPNSANPNTHGTGGFFWSPDNLGAAVAQSVPTLSKSASSPGLRQQNARQLDEWYEINRKAQYSLRAMNQCGHETDMLMERVSEAKRESLSRAVEGLNETLDETRRKADAKQEQHYQLKREMLTARKEWLAQGGQQGATHEARKVDALETMIEQVEGAYRTEGDRMQATHSPLPPLTHPHSPSRPSHAPAGRQSHGAHTPHPHHTSSSSETTRARVTLPPPSHGSLRQATYQHMTRRLVAELTAQRLATEALRAETSRTDAATAVALESLAVVRSNHRELVSQEDEYIRLCTCHAALGADPSTRRPAHTHMRSLISYSVCGSRVRAAPHIMPEQTRSGRRSWRRS